MTRKKKVALALGGNQGNVAATFKWAVRELEKHAFNEICCSSFYQTAPVGFREAENTFLNAAVTGVWRNSAAELRN